MNEADWWNNETQSAWERLKDALKRDWERTKSDLKGKPSANDRDAALVDASTPPVDTGRPR